MTDPALDKLPDDPILWGWDAIAAAIGRDGPWLKAHVLRGGILAEAVQRADGIRDPWSRRSDIVRALLSRSQPVTQGDESGSELRRGRAG